MKNFTMPCYRRREFFLSAMQLLFFCAHDEIRHNAQEFLLRSPLAFFRGLARAEKSQTFQVCWTRVIFYLFFFVCFILVIFSNFSTPFTMFTDFYDLLLKWRTKGDFVEILLLFDNRRKKFWDSWNFPDHKKNFWSHGPRESGCKNKFSVTTWTTMNNYLLIRSSHGAFLPQMNLRWHINFG